ncbi:hypothetical protein [Parafannyhessea umbonata]|uniref:Uncharacterized protein n=1 Tax=Parafannyhessea umbonata TaxID=604330 RepID=A0A6N7XBK9_9ACTN|nr:hypothetical protein [Parafannyhessea umbonata]MST60669.1 hypothetical protein [Parafannyhessea umbonata]
MDGDLDGKAVQGTTGEGDSGEQALAQEHEDIQEDGTQEVTGRAVDGAADYQAALKRQIADERVVFALKAADARSVKAARALLEEHDGDVAALVAAEPWLFEGTEGTSQSSSQTSAGGATGLEPAGASGGSDDQYMRRWERIAGLADEGKE